MHLTKLMIAGISILLFTSMVAAQGIGDFSRDVLDNIGDILSPIFEVLLNSTSFDEYLFVKVLFLVILFFLIKLALERFPPFEDKGGITTIIAISVSLISVRYLGEIGVIRGILLPYGVLAVALTTILPFLIFFFFVHRTISTGIGRRLAWIFYLIILSGIWLYRYDELSDVSNYIYSGIFFLGILLIIFDRKVKQYFALAEVNEARRNINADQISKSLKEFNDHYDTYRRTGSKHSLRALKRYGNLLKKWGVRNLPDY
jgi:hypothetical protein